MKFFVDTADVDAIAELNELGMVDGVTTNPSLILKSGRDILEVTREIADMVDGPVSAEVVATEADAMIAEGRKLAKIADNIAVKVPLTWDGLKACKVLSGEGNMVNVTLCFSANQALLAAKAGATFISPFIGRLDDINLDGMELIADIRRSTTTTASRPRSSPPRSAPSNHAFQSARIGADVMTAPPDVIKQDGPAPADRQGAGRVPGRLGKNRAENRLTRDITASAKKDRGRDSMSSKPRSTTPCANASSRSPM